MMGGHSYEIWAWMTGIRIYPDGKRINGRLVGTINEQRGGDPLPGSQFNDPAYTYVLKTTTTVESLSKVLLVLDADDKLNTNSESIENFPDPSDNHGDGGSNMNFLDGHASWIAAGRDTLTTYLDSYSKGILSEDNYLYSEYLPTFSQTSAGAGYIRYSY